MSLSLLLFCSFTALLFFPGIILNLLLITVLFKINNQHKSYFALIRSLILADLVLPLMTTLFLSVSQVVDRYTWNQYYYPYSVFYEYLLYVILLNLIALALEHYVAIIKPFHYVNWIRYRYIVCRLCIIWMIPGLLVFFGYLIPETKVTLMDTWNHSSEKNVTQVFKGDIDMKDVYRIPFILVCFIIMAIVYIHIYCIVRKKQRHNQLQNQHAKNNNKALVTTIFILLSFFLCWFPPVVTEIWFQLYKPTVWSDFVSFHFFMRQIVPLTMYLNSICDPLIFVVRLAAVQKMWRRNFCCCCSLCRRKSILKGVYDSIKMPICKRDKTTITSK